MIQLAIVTGVSGAGKTFVLSCFEENQYYVIDNIPLSVIPSLFKEFIKKPDQYKKVAIAVNLSIARKVYELARLQKDFSVIFLGLDCSKEALIERFRLSRRLHPAEHQGLTLEECLSKDKKNILTLRQYFTHYVDTSKLTLAECRQFLNENVFSSIEGKLNVNFISFGYKKSVPQDIETVLDVRILPNPFWVKELKYKTGLDKEVRDYIFDSPITKEYLKRATDYLDFFLEQVALSGRKMITIAIACSGGEHRSVAVAEYFKKHYSKLYHTSSSHRELKK